MKNKKEIYVSPVVELVVLKEKDIITVMDPSFGFRKYSLSEWKNISTNVYIEYKPNTNVINIQEAVQKLTSKIKNHLK